MSHYLPRFQWIMSLTAFVLVAMLWVQRRADRDRMSFHIYYNNTVPAYLAIDTRENSLTGTFFVNSVDPSHIAKSVKSEIKDGQQRSLGVYEWKVTQPPSPSVFPQFSLTIPSTIHAQALNISIIAE